MFQKKIYTLQTRTGITSKTMKNLLILLFLIFSLFSCASLTPDQKYFFLGLGKTAAIKVLEDVGGVEVDFEQDTIRVSKILTVAEFEKVVGKKLYLKIAPNANATFENQLIRTGGGIEYTATDSLRFSYFRFRKSVMQ